MVAIIDAHRPMERFVLYGFLQFWTSGQTYVSFNIVSHILKEFLILSTVILSSEGESDGILNPLKGGTNCMCTSHAFRTFVMLRNIFPCGLTVLSEIATTLRNF